MILDLVADEMLKSPPSDRAYSPTLGPGELSEKPLQFSGPQKVLRLRLGPLKQIQKDLETIIGSPSSEPVDLSATHMNTPPAAFLDHEDSSEPLPSPEFFIRSNCGWKSALNKLRLAAPGLSERNSSDGERSKALKRTDEVSEVIHSCKDDMKALWADPVVRDLLKKRDLSLDEHSGL